MQFMVRKYKCTFIWEGRDCGEGWASVQIQNVTQRSFEEIVLLGWLDCVSSKLLLYDKPSKFATLYILHISDGNNNQIINQASIIAV